MVDVKSMSDAELSEIIERDELVKAARAEVERRRIENNPNIITIRDSSEPCDKATTTASCPNCGRNDNIRLSKTMYATPSLANGHKPSIGTAVLCGCGVWYNAGTGTYEIPETTFYSY